jgi:uncharacterized protein YaiE (UPF0345 family)
MEITKGDVEVLLPNSSEWICVSSNESFEVPAKSKFQIKVKSVTDYCCSYL